MVLLGYGKGYCQSDTCEAGEAKQRSRISEIHQQGPPQWLPGWTTSGKTTWVPEHPGKLRFSQGVLDHVRVPQTFPECFRVDEPTTVIHSSYICTIYDLALPDCLV
jgi:hypothetical protein